MANDVVPEDYPEDIVVLDTTLEEFVLEDVPDYIDIVSVDWKSKEVLLVSSEVEPEAVSSLVPIDLGVIDVEFDREVIVSREQGPPGDEGPRGDEGPEGAHVVDIEVSGSNLITYLSNGLTIDAGEIPSGNYTPQLIDFGFAIPSTLWVCTHNFGTKAVRVVTYDPSGNEIIGDVNYVDDNVVEIEWYHPNGGSAQLSI